MTIVSKMPIEYFGEVSIYFGVGVQVVAALILGGMVGYDREKKLKSAGIKTNILICIGATLYTVMGTIIAAGSGGLSDPNRIAAQIVSGIGFLGAGAIMQSQGSVVGMTTAATIWVVAAIGFTIGAGYPITAAIFTFSVLLVLKLVNPIYRLIDRGRDYDYFQLDILSKGSVKRAVRGLIEIEDLIIEDIFEEPVEGKKNSKITTVFLRGRRTHMERIAQEAKRVLKVQDVSYHSVSHSLRASFEKHDKKLITENHSQVNGKKTDSHSQNGNHKKGDKNDKP